MALSRLTHHCNLSSFITLFSLPLDAPSSEAAQPLALGRSLTDFILKTNVAQNDLTAEPGAFRNSDVTCTSI
jgi:hypothetical protein